LTVVAQPTTPTDLSSDMPTFRSPSLLLVLAVASVASSCNEDEALIQKREQQLVEIAKLRGELTLIEAKLADIPPDRSQELAETRAKIEEQTAAADQLEKEIGELNARRRAIENEFDQYRRNYAIK
jgi:septal ring factor EnvC (AmiA/AmiB activator)